MAFGEGAKAGDVFLEGHYRNAATLGREMATRVNPVAARAGQEASRHFGRRFAAGLAVGGAVVGVGLAKGVKAALRGIEATTDAASALNEQVNKSNAIFGSSSKGIQRWAKGAAGSFGQSRRQALANAAAFGDMFLQLKLGQEPATRMSKRMVELASDLASFNDADISQVLEAQQSAFRGEYDALQRFIPNINAARVQQEALRLTHKKTAKDLTAADKALATYTIMVNDSRRAHGDYADTLETSVANQNRKAAAQWEDLKTTLGQGFLPAQLAITRAFTEKLLPALGLLVARYGPTVGRVVSGWAERFARLVPSTRELGLGLEALQAAFAGEGITTSSDKFVGKMERLGLAARKTVDWVKSLRPHLGELRDAGVQLGLAFSHAGVGTHVFADSLAIVGPVLEVAARNIHNIIPWLPVLLTGLLAFRGVKTALGPVRDLGQTIANFTSPVQAAATIANARANKVLAAAYRERTAAALPAAAAEAELAAATAASGAAAQTAAGRWALLRGGLLRLVPAAAAIALGYEGLTVASEHTHGPQQRLIQGVKDFLFHGGLAGIVIRKLTGDTQAAATATGTAASAADRYATALRNERAALQDLRGALDAEKGAELDLRQAKLNVQAAQARLNQLKREGKQGSAEYRQAQIDLGRAQLAAKEAATQYRAAVARSNDAERTAAHLADVARGALDKLKASTFGARKQITQFGLDASEAFRKLKSKRLSVTAQYNIGAPQGIELLIEKGLVRHQGGPVPGAPGGERLAKLRVGEHVWTDREVVAAGGHRAMERWRKAVLQGLVPEFHGGGPVVDYRGMRSEALLDRLPRFDRNLQRSMDASARGFGKWAATFAAFPPHVAGGWKVALDFLKGLGIAFTVISTFRPGARTRASGAVSYHARNRAVDLVGPNMLAIERALERTNPTELIYSRAPRYFARGRWKPIGMLDPITYRDHLGHVHVAYHQGGRLPENVVGVGPSGRSYSFQGGETITPRDRPLLDARSARMIGQEVAAALADAPPPVIYLDRQKVSRAVATGDLWNSRRG